MWMTIALVAVLLIAAVLLFATTRPDTFRVERSLAIKAPPDRIFPLLDDFHRWPEWSPWEKLDPAMARTHSGAPRGVGAVYEWRGNAKVGQGRMELMQSTPASALAIKLDFIKPFEGHNIAEFTLKPQDDATLVHWAMHGPTPYVSKLMGMFLSMDTLIGRDFEAGLANLKAAAEKA